MIPGWRQGVRNGLVFGILALGAVMALNAGELPGLGAILAELPAAVGISAAVHIPQILLTAAAWRALLPPGLRPPFAAMALLRWYRESANALVPAGALVGQAAAARLLARRGVPGRMAGATATVDLTLEAVSQLFFTLAGVALLLGVGDGPGLLGFALAGFGIALAGAAAMVLFQRRLPLTLLERLLARLARRWPAIDPAWIRELQEAILQLHADWPRLAVATLWHTISWLLGAIEIAGVLWLLGHPISLADALVIESLAQALRNVGFMLPGALAVQEGAIIGAAALVGVPPAAALAVALVRRTREVCLSLPGLIAWQRAESGSMRSAGPDRGGA
ncbi:lysylphosphatidylglycerol synthase domain-containing protein [Belnapia rosea]|uniref:Putative membrane protein n=1 Tax=Belnapia rosea TaxID=938405 RepID=A0A1G6KZS2_9PROT|nr:lysylphosphatidylglycerol synthase domain-containing protein [Belnapia rosea]SDC36454.1 putative membrane protein [Belnapia rosea]